MTKKREVERVSESSKERKTAGRAEPADVCLGMVIRSRRVIVGITQAELGKEIGVSYQQIQKYETGANRVSFSKLLSLAVALDCNAAEICKDVEKELRRAHSDG